MFSLPSAKLWMKTQVGVGSGMDSTGRCFSRTSTVCAQRAVPCSQVVFPAVVVLPSGSSCQSLHPWLHSGHVPSEVSEIFVSSPLPASPDMLSQKEIREILCDLFLMNRGYLLLKFSLSSKHFNRS